ncbi:hypothetical protein RDABS01_021983, partial [Bienertia sinuspersici]
MSLVVVVDLFVNVKGNLADPRTRSTAKRPDILEALDKRKQRDNLSSDADKKVKLMCSYCKKHDETGVPDPYYGRQKGGFVK